MLTFTFLLSFTGIASIGLKSLDAVMLGKFLPLHFVGIYAIVSFIPTIIEAPYNALDRIVGVKVAHSIVDEDLVTLKDIYYKSVKYLSVIGGLVFIGVNCNIVSLLHLVGKDYSAGVGVVWIISLGSLINMMGGSNNAILMYSARYWVTAMISIILVALTFACNMLLIPRFGLHGAAFSTAVSCGIYACIRVYLLNRKFGFQPYGAHTMKTIGIIIVCLFIHLILPAFQSNLLDLVVRSTVLGFAYLVLVYFLRIVPEFHRFLPWVRNE